MKWEKLVVIEDEDDIREVIEHNLSREGYCVKSSSDGYHGYELVKREAPDLVLLDLMLPGMNGMEVCKKLRKDPVARSIPIIMVTAKSEESDVVRGLGLGADDYLTKPFSPRELVERVKAVLRRGPLKGDGTDRQRLVFEGVIIDGHKHKVYVDDMSVDFTATEFKLLFLLASNAGNVFTRAHLLDRVMGDDNFIVDRNIDVHVRALRRKLGSYKSLIETVRGVGYRFQDE